MELKKAYLSAATCNLCVINSYTLQTHTRTHTHKAMISLQISEIMQINTVNLVFGGTVDTAVE